MGAGDHGTNTEIPDADSASTHGWTLPALVRHAADTHGNREFLAFEDGRTVTFAEFDELTDRLAAALADIGLQPGDRLLGLLTNSAEFMLLMIATHKRRAIFVPVNTDLRGAFLEHQVRNSEPRIVAVDRGLLSRFDDVAAPTSTTDEAAAGMAARAAPEPDWRIETTLLVNDEDAHPSGGVTGGVSTDSALAGTTVLPLEQLLGTEPRDDAVLEAEPSDVCTIMYTSGTTGPAKGVLMPQAHCYLFGLTAAQRLEITPDDRFFCCMPLFHANGLFMQIYAALHGGASAYVTKRFGVGQWLDTVIDQGITLTNALGVMPEFIWRSPPTDRDRAHRLRAVIALPVAAEWAAAFEQRFGVRIVQGYGMTEVNMVAYTDPADAVMSGCAGPPLDEYFEVIVADPATDLPLSPDEIGEILVRPKVPFCFNVGYHQMTAKTVEAWRNLWFHTGDAGRIDPAGRLHFVDRLNDRIRRRGENISSYEVETVINGYDGVIESAVVGLRVEGAGGEDEVLAVVALDGSPPDPVEFLDWCVPRMPRHSVPRYLQFVPELDKTASGKIRKQAIRDAGVTGDLWDRESIGYIVARG
ncbi:AMP-binding protein [Candidatus Poriferisodalis sp.]|uniref:AMP-binding protein n=1 Tax=Candidatus Poriferisodalis sp. TaxID=3101277 RepID=UPI003B516651